MPEMTSVTNNDITSSGGQKPFITECDISTTDGELETPDIVENDVISCYSESGSQAAENESDDISDVTKELSITDEVGWDTDLEIEDEKTEYDLSGARIYLATCRELNVVPVSYFVRHMQDEELVMRHHGLGPSGAKALAIPLLTNTTVTALDLTDNWLEAEGAIHLGEMLKDNCYITYLTISENRLGNEGATAMCEMLLSNTTLMSVDLSGNGFTDKDSQRFAQIILENTSLRELSLSHNAFGDGAGFVLGHAIGENETLEMIDLSWNHFRGRSAQNIIEGVTVNSRLKRISLAWNGLGDDGAMAIAECIRQNQVLTELDISYNRITKYGTEAISRALDSNETLVIFRIGHNTISADGALFLINSINNERSILEELDLTDICVDSEFEKVQKEMEQSRTVKVRHGGVLGSFGQKPRKRKKHELNHQERAALKALEDFLQNDPMAVLQEHVESRNLRLIDLFRDLDKNNDFKIDINDLKRKVKSTGIVMSEDKIDQLIDRMDKDNNGLVDYSMLVVGKAQTVIRTRRLSQAVIETFESAGRTALPAKLREMPVVQGLLRKRMPKLMSENLSRAVDEDEDDDDDENG